MALKEDILKKLRAAFDLNIYEVKIWTALLSRGLATAGELSDISSVPRSRSYDVLESLEKKGFVLMKLGKPIKYIAVEPEEIIRRLKDGIQNTAESRMKFLENVKSEDTFSELELLYKQGIEKIEPFSLTGALRGRDNVYTHLKTMMERAEKSVCIMTTKEGLLRKAKRYKSLFKKLNDRGVRIKIIVPAVNGNQEEVKKIAQLKASSAVNARFVIIDENEMLFMMADDREIHENYDTAVWVSTPFFARAMGKMFNNLWQSIEEQ